MTKYENLMNKAEKCRENAKATSGLMRAIWEHHAINLEQKAKSLSIKEAESKIFLIES